MDKGRRFQGDIFLEDRSAVADWRTLPVAGARSANIDLLELDKTEYDRECRFQRMAAGKVR